MKNILIIGGIGLGALLLFSFKSVASGLPVGGLTPDQDSQLRAKYDRMKERFKQYATSITSHIHVTNLQRQAYESMVNGFITYEGFKQSFLKVNGINSSNIQSVIDSFNPNDIDFKAVDNGSNLGKQIFSGILNYIAPGSGTAVNQFAS